MFVVTLSKTSLKKLGLGAMCCALVVCSALLGRFISQRTVTVSAAVNRIESAQDIQTWFTGYGLDVDGASITADKVKIPRKWDDSFSAFSGYLQVERAVYADALQAVHKLLRIVAVMFVDEMRNADVG